MYSTTLNIVFTSFIVLGIAPVQQAYSHQVGENNEGFGSPPMTEPFLPITDEHRAAWNRVLEYCLPLNSRDSLGDHCITSLGEYFANEPVWSYNHMFVYQQEGWLPLYHDELSQRRNHSAADFLDTDVPFWRHIFDDQIMQRQELFLRVVKDSKCQEITRNDNEGMQDYWAEHCAVREMYKYATYLSACFDANRRLTELHRVFPEDNPLFGGLNFFEYSFQLLDDFVTDEALKSSAKRSMEKGFLHASWVAVQCNQHGFVLKPGKTIGSYTSTEEKLPWSIVAWNVTGPWNNDERKYHWQLYHTHDFTMKVAIKSGDDWAVRSGYLGVSYVAEFSDDLRQRYPLLMHRVIGENPYGFGYGRKFFTWEDSARHRAKAYLLLVEEAGEEFARSEYDPAELTEEIEYVKSGGLLRSPPTHTDLLDEERESSRKYEEEELIREAQGELVK